MGVRFHDVSLLDMFVDELLGCFCFFFCLSVDLAVQGWQGVGFESDGVILVSLWGKTL